MRKSIVLFTFILLTLIFFGTRLVHKAAANAASDDLVVKGSLTAAETLYVVKESGKVGINVASPTQSLDVDGNINVIDGSYMQNGRVVLHTSPDNYGVFVGVEAGTANNEDGLFNTFIGHQAGRNTTSGSGLTAVGYQALYSNKSLNAGTAVGYQALFRSLIGGTAVGYQALANNTSGEGNVAVGLQALYSNRTASNNVAIGYRALYSSRDDDGDNNIAIGYEAISAGDGGGGNIAIGTKALRHTKGDNNIAIGTLAGYNIRYSNSDSNIAIGAWSLYAGAGARGNIAIGDGAMRQSVDGDNNTIIGYLAGFGAPNQSFSNNTFLGYLSGFSVSSGSNNVLIGYRSGQNLTTGSNNIIIGYDINALAPDINNTLNIGNLIFGTNLDGTGKSVSSGNIGIGTQNPSHRLTVAGALCVDGSGGDECALQVIDAGSIWAKEVSGEKGIFSRLELKDEETGTVYCIKIHNGELLASPGSCKE